MTTGTPSLGILMLPGKMAVVPGCMACDASFRYPVIRRTVAGARPPRSREAAEAMLPLYLVAARQLARDGAAVITDNCNGAMVFLQDRLAAAVPVPVVTSALLLVPLLHRLLPERRIGILAFDAAAVDEEICNACGFSGAAVPLAVAGVADRPSWQEFLRTKEIPQPLLPRLQDDLAAAAGALRRAHPDLGALVSECTLLPPACQSLRETLGLPVFDILTCLDMAMAGCSRPAGAARGAGEVRR